MSEYIEQAVNVLHTQNQLLSHHPNASLYTNLAQYVELDGFYLESEPCLVCNNPEVPFSTIKLSTIKVIDLLSGTLQFGMDGDFVCRYCKGVIKYWHEVSIFLPLYTFNQNTVCTKHFIYIRMSEFFSKKT